MVACPAVRHLIASSVLAAALWAPPASADLVYLQGGRTLSVKAHRLEDGQYTFVLRSGGEVQCDASLVERVEPDELPYPEPTQAPLALSVVGALPGGRPFEDLIEPLAARHGVDPNLVRAVIEVESSFQPSARSPKGAVGLMQLMPATALQYGVANAYAPEENVDAGIRHLRSLLDRFDLPLALAAYNAGEGAVRRHGGIPPYSETQAYVRRVLARTTSAR